MTALTPSQRQARMRAKRKRYEEALREIATSQYWDGADYLRNVARAALTPDKETQG